MALGRERRLGFVEEEDPTVKSILNDCKEAFPVGSAMKGSAAVGVVWVPGHAKPRVVRSLVEKRSKVGMKLGAKKVAVGRPPSERWAQDVRQMTVPLGPMRRAKIAARTARHGQAIQIGNGFEQSGFARTVFTDEERNRTAKGQRQPGNEGQRKRERALRGQSFLNNSEADEVWCGLCRHVTNVPALPPPNLLPSSSGRIRKARGSK